MFWHYIKIVVESIFPIRPDYALVNEAREDALLDFLSPITTDNVTYLLPFKAPLVRATVHEAKFQGNAKAWRMLARVLEAHLKQIPEHTIIIPIPLSFRRRLKRGYNQVTKVARLAVKDLPLVELNENSLFRRRHTKPQTEVKNREERTKNMSEAFNVRNPATISGQNIIVIDDVTTTGSTLKAAEAALRSSNLNSVTLLALAH